MQTDFVIISTRISNDGGEESGKQERGHSCLFALRGDRARRAATDADKDERALPKRARKRRRTLATATTSEGSKMSAAFVEHYMLSLDVITALFVRRVCVRVLSDCAHQEEARGAVTWPEPRSLEMEVPKLSQCAACWEGLKKRPHTPLNIEIMSMIVSMNNEQWRAHFDF